MNIKKAIVSFTAAAALALSMAGLVGCSAENEDEAMIRESLTAELESIKTVDEDFVDGMTSGAGVDALEAYGVGTGEFLVAYFDGFDYTVEVSVNDEGTTAEATVVLTCRDFGDYAKALADNVAKVEAGDEAAMEQAVTDAIESVEPAELEPIVIVYEKEDNVWTPAPESEGAVISALMA